MRRLSIKEDVYILFKLTYVWLFVQKSRCASYINTFVVMCSSFINNIVPNDILLGLAVGSVDE